MEFVLKARKERMEEEEGGAAITKKGSTSHPGDGKAKTNKGGPKKEAGNQKPIS